MLVAVAYNEPAPRIYGEERDRISEEAVLEEVSDVKRVLEELGHRVALIPMGGDAESFISRLLSLRPDCIFNLCEGAYGCSVYEACFPSLYELLRIPYTGSPSTALGICLDKPRAKYMLLGAGIPTPEFHVASSLEELHGRSYRFPLMVKPSREDASIGISWGSVVSDESALRDRVGYLLERYRQPALIEEFIEGRELNVSLIGNSSPEVLSISEVDFSRLDRRFKILTYNGKWDRGSRDYAETPIICPADLDEPLKEKIMELSRRAYGILGCRGYARIDFRVADPDEPYIIDVNPNPDISRGAGFARSAEKAGIPYNQLISRIIELALEPYPRPMGSTGDIAVRWMKEGDAPHVIEILRRVGVFREREIEVAAELINAYVKGADKDYLVYVAECNGRIAGYICFGPTPLTDGVFDVYWIAVDPRFQERGIGRRLISCAEEYARSRGGRKIMVETSSRREYGPARSLYEEMGYREAARILDFYSQGDTKIIYEKGLGKKLDNRGVGREGIEE
ncbi:MAG: GNAT family N-acetyltransferase [Candidatus Bathyarchaeia archaeon]